MNISRLPEQERPRERLLNAGPGQLSLPELIAILLTTGTKERSVLDLAHDVVGHFGSVEKLVGASITELMEVNGIGQAKAIQLQAAFEIALRMKHTPKSKDPIRTREAYELVRHELAHQKQEMLMVIMKDVKGKLIGLEKVAVGTLSDILIHPREVFFPAVRHKASSLILAHNHPSGDPTPSAADLELTRHLVRSGRIMGINLDDHLIVGADSFVSLKETGLFG